jgi:pyrroline-5-carboxylate reductase
MPDLPYELALIGAGNMAEAIARGVLSAGLFARGRIIASDPVEARRRLFAEQLGIRAVDDNASAAGSAAAVLLAVKPQQMRDVVAGLAGRVRAETRVISIMAGVSTATLEGLLAHVPARVVRCMPNLPMAVKAGMSALAPGRHARPEDVEHAAAIFRAAGDVVVLGEKLMDAVTAMSGSGPAYFYFWTEAMIEAGVQLGLSREDAAKLAKNTALGAARMMLECPEPPEELRRRVTSPGGTTLAAVTSMNVGHVRDEIVKAVHAAARRSSELGQ